MTAILTSFLINPSESALLHVTKPWTGFPWATPLQTELLEEPECALGGRAGNVP